MTPDADDRPINSKTTIIAVAVPCMGTGVAMVNTLDAGRLLRHIVPRVERRGGFWFIFDNLDDLRRQLTAHYPNFTIEAWRHPWPGVTMIHKCDESTG